MLFFGDCDGTHAAGELVGAGHVGEQQQIGELSQLRHTDDRQSLTRSTGNKAFVHIRVLVYQLWRDGGQQGLEEFGHLSPLHRRAIYLFIQLFNCWPGWDLVELSKNIESFQICEGVLNRG